MQAFDLEAKKSTVTALPMFRTAGLCVLLATARCAAPEGQRASVQPPPPPLASRALAGTLPTDANGQPIRVDDPPAPADTQLCGLQAREANAIGAALPSAHLATIGACAGFTCYDPLTATYIGADQVRHVCR